MKDHPATVMTSRLEGADWFKSSYSNGGGNCVEAADLSRATHASQLEGADWFKSSYSNNGGSCVEAADLTNTPHARVAVRDSKAPNGPALLLDSAPFGAFIAAVRSGRFGF